MSGECAKLHKHHQIRLQCAHGCAWLLRCCRPCVMLVLHVRCGCCNMIVRDDCQVSLSGLLKGLFIWCSQSLHIIVRNMLGICHHSNCKYSGYFFTSLNHVEGHCASHKSLSACIRCWGCIRCWCCISELVAECMVCRGGMYLCRGRQQGLRQPCSLRKWWTYIS